MSFGILLLSSWLGHRATPSSGAEIEVEVAQLARLTNHVYGCEHLLLWGRRTNADDRVMPTLLRYGEGARLEDELGGGAPGTSAADLLARRDFFSLARGGVGISTLDLARLAGDTPLSTVMLRHLQSSGVRPTGVSLGADDGSVRQQNMGMFTEPAAASVRLSAVGASLVCEAASPTPRSLRLPLDGAGEAAAVGTRGGLPFRVAVELWERHACEQSTIDHLLVPSDETGPSHATDAHRMLQ